MLQIKDPVFSHSLVWETLPAISRIDRPSHTPRNSGIVVPHAVFRHFPRDQETSSHQIFSLPIYLSSLSSKPVHFRQILALANTVGQGLFCSPMGNQHKAAFISVGRISWHPRQGYWERLLGNGYCEHRLLNKTGPGHKSQPWNTVVTTTSWCCYWSTSITVAIPRHRHYPCPEIFPIRILETSVLIWRQRVFKSKAVAKECQLALGAMQRPWYCLLLEAQPVQTPPLLTLSPHHLLYVFSSRSSHTIHPVDHQSRYLHITKFILL